MADNVRSVEVIVSPAFSGGLGSPRGLASALMGERPSIDMVEARHGERRQPPESSVHYWPVKTVSRGYIVTFGLGLGALLVRSRPRVKAPSKNATSEALARLSRLWAVGGE
jgi:hypothetical protein